jgi:hypothetical protein
VTTAQALQLVFAILLSPVAMVLAYFLYDRPTRSGASPDPSLITCAPHQYGDPSDGHGHHTDRDRCDQKPTKDLSHIS